MYQKPEPDPLPGLSDDINKLPSSGEQMPVIKVELAAPAQSPNTSIAPGSLTPMELLSIEVQRGGNLEALSKLMDLQERFEKLEAWKAYTRDMAAFKSDPPKLIKDKQVKAGSATWLHAELDQVAGKIAAALSKYGFSHSWNFIQQNGLISVTCTITHVLGHSAQVSLSAPPDSSGSKSPIQQIGSTITYLERYTILGITGLAAGTDDNDGCVDPVSQQMDLTTFQAHVIAIREAVDLPSLQVVWKLAMDEAKDKRTQKIFIDQKNDRKAELQRGVE